MGATLGGEGNGVHLDVSVVDVMKAEPSTVFDEQGLKVTALGIPHANMPTVTYRVETRDGSIVFSSDQNGTSPKFTDFARSANVLVMHLAIAPSCSFDTREQCMETISGIGGFCIENQYYHRVAAPLPHRGHVAKVHKPTRTHSHVTSSH
jgi:hypothetical protein